MTQLFVVTCDGHDSSELLGCAFTREGAEALAQAHWDGYWKERREWDAQDEDHELRYFQPTEQEWKAGRLWKPGDCFERPLYAFYSPDSVHEWLTITVIESGAYVGQYAPIHNS